MQRSRPSGHGQKNFLGFPKFGCVRCFKANTYPASTGMVVLNWILAGIFTALFCLCLVNGHFITPGVIFVAGFWGIIANAKIRREHQAWHQRRMEGTPVEGQAGKPLD